MSFLLHSRPLGIGLGLGAAFTSYSLLTPRRTHYALCDSSASNAFNSYTSNAKVPVFAESQLGISLIPYGRMQRYFTSIDLRSTMQDNVAFKLAFGATFALTGFAQL
ncbi:hypothetical protein KCU91_g523, partial [Aureobasidium melanogenum]